MKTAMQEMIDFIESNFQDIQAGGCANLLKGLSTNLLAKEKQQIAKAWDDHEFLKRQTLDGISNVDGEFYYNKTFKKNP